MAPPLRGDEVSELLEAGLHVEDKGEADGPTETERQVKSGHLEAEAAHTPEAANEEVLEAEDPVEVGLVCQGAASEPKCPKRLLCDGQQKSNLSRGPSQRSRSCPTAAQP